MQYRAESTSASAMRFISETAGRGWFFRGPGPKHPLDAPRRRTPSPGGPARRRRGPRFRTGARGISPRPPRTDRLRAPDKDARSETDKWGVITPTVSAFIRRLLFSESCAFYFLFFVPRSEFGEPSRFSQQWNPICPTCLLNNLWCINISVTDVARVKSDGAAHNYWEIRVTREGGPPSWSKFVIEAITHGFIKTITYLM